MVVCSKIRKKKCTNTAQCEWKKGKCVKKKPSTAPQQRTCKKTKCALGKVTTPNGKKCVNLEYVDRGGYGCVVHPPIVDKEYIITDYLPYQNKDNTDISKVFRRQKDFEEELEFLDIIAGVDPHRHITVNVKGAQEIAGKCLIHSKLVAHCLTKGEAIENKSFYQIILEHGGVRVNKRDAYKLTYLQFLQCMKKMISGMIKLQEKNIVHRDIKPDNVLYKTSQNKLNLIDFGLMCPHYSELYDPNNRGSMHLLEYKEYHTYPPEFYVAYIMFLYRDYYDGNKAKFNSFLENDLIRKLHNHRFFHTDFLMHNSILKREYEEGIKSFIETMKASGISKSTDIFNREIAMKADVFAFAYIIASLKRNIIRLSEYEEEFIDILYRSCIRANPYDRATFLELYSILSSEYTRSVLPMASVRTNKGGGILSNIKTKIKNKLQPFLSLTVNKIKNILDKRIQSPRRYSTVSSSPRSVRRLSPITPISSTTNNKTKSKTTKQRKTTL